MREKKMCGAHARSTGKPCQAKGLANGRCKNHGGLSTGPTSFAGKMAVSAAASQRMAAGQRERALAGFYAWLDGGGREMLSMLAKGRFERQRWLRGIQS
jgi:hypothetical protein